MLFATIGVLGALAGGPLPDERSSPGDRVREQWVLSLDAVSRVPLDVGAELAIETPFRMRLSGAYAWVPSAYARALTGFASSFAGDARADAVLDGASYGGTTYRFAAGVRPFSALGLYIDAGYGHADLNVGLDVSRLRAFGVTGLSGGYRADMDLDLWLIEVGYQGVVAERVVLGAGLGINGVLDSHTTIVPTGGAPDHSALSEAAERGDAAFESYGVFPTLTLRLGVDLI